MVNTLTVTATANIFKFETCALLYEQRLTPVLCLGVYSHFYHMAHYVYYNVLTKINSVAGIF